MKESSKGPTIVFGLLSYRSSSDAVSQFADAVYPHTVLVHHDFHQMPDFNVDRENVAVIETPHRTSWGNWSLVEATLMLIEHAIATSSWDYFQLVSESCLPTRPIQEFADYLEHTQPDVMIDMCPLGPESPALMMNYAWRYLPRSPLMKRIARRAGLWCIGNNFNYLECNSGNIKIPSAAPKAPMGMLKSFIGMKILTSFHMRRVGAFPIREINQCWVGSQWFGLSRTAALRVLTEKKSTPELEAHFQNCPIPDESYIQTLVATCSFNNIQPSNHITFWKRAGFGPDELTESDVPRVKRSNKFFARKFSLNSDCPARHQILQPSKTITGSNIQMETGASLRSCISLDKAQPLSLQPKNSSISNADE